MTKKFIKSHLNLRFSKIGSAYSTLSIEQIGPIRERTLAALLVHIYSETPPALSYSVQFAVARLKFPVPQNGTAPTK